MPTTGPICQVIRPEHSYNAKQGMTYFEGISPSSAGAQGICLHLLTIPPGGRGKAHLHWMACIFRGRRSLRPCARWSYCTIGCAWPP
jgi:uncharacterized RmlC-like cupin family protein